MNSLDAANQARLKKNLDKLYRFDEGVLTLREWIAGGITRKSTYVQEYSERRIELAYKNLVTPKVHYTLWKGERGLEVPKIVWDTVQAPNEGTH